jgi:hypothetical protein
MKATAQSIFRVNSLDRYVVTRFLEDSNFHGHLPVVSMNQRLLWYRFANTSALGHTFVAITFTENNGQANY